MVGTMKVSLARSFCMASSTFTSSKAGMMTCVHSRIISCSVRPAPPTWNMGAMFRPTASAGRVAAMLAESWPL
ncbi:hypothetical protein D9M69_575430 [compost metagenome]